MKNNQNINVSKSEEFNLAYVEVNYKFAQRVTLQIIPEDGNLLMLMRDECGSSLEYDKNELIQKQVPVEIFSINIKHWLKWHKKRIDWLFIKIPYIKRLQYVDIELFREGLACYSLILENEAKINHNVLSDIFGDNTDWLHCGKRLFSWLDNTFVKTKCKYIVLLEYESLDIGIVCRLNELDGLIKQIESIISSEHIFPPQNINDEGHE